MGIDWNAVGPGFGETMGLRLRVGRPIGWDDVRSARRVAVINEAAAEYFFGRVNPIGRALIFASTRAPGAPYDIVGVIQNAKYGSVRGPAPRTAYIPFTAMPATLAGLTFELRTSAAPMTLLPSVRRVLHDVDANLALANVRTVTEQVDQSLWQERLFARLMTAFGALAIALAAIGLYGAMSYAVARQTREIGVRMAIGAQRGQVLRMVLARAVRLTLLGVAVGLPATLAAGRAVSSQLFGVSAADPATLAAAVAALLALMASAGLLPARHASQVDPMVALRGD
jgi:predicted permease